MPHYTVTTLPQQHLFQVVLRFSYHSDAPIQLSLPNWVPGSYMIREFARHITGLKACCNGTPAPLRQTDKNTWQAEFTQQGQWEVVYHVYTFDLSVRGCYLDSTRGFFDGAALFVRVHGQTEQPHQADFRFPEHWQIATALPHQPDGSYAAGSYAEFIDHPVEAGPDLEILSFSAGGLPHRIILSGHYADFDRRRLLDDTQAICCAQLAFFPQPTPFDGYTFLLHVGDFVYGGLEHRASTALLADRTCLPAHGMGAADEAYTQLLGLISHEYFHAWNVKSIRPAAFAESDLNHEAYTEQLWAFEGITSYYDDLFLVRSGVISPEGYLNLLAQNISRVQQGHGRRLQTLAESSFRAWDKYYKPNENSPNALVSYYQKGALAALCLDLSIRRLSRQTHSLDSVMQALYRDWLNHGTPLQEGDWERRAQALTGLDLRALFDHFIRSTDDLPLADCLAEAGLQLQWLPLARGQLGGFGDRPPTADAVADFGARFKQNPTDISLTHVFSGGSAEQAGLAAGDRVVALNGYAITQFATQWAIHRPGSRLDIHYFRHGVLQHTQLTAQPATAETAWLFLQDSAALDNWLGAA